MVRISDGALVFLVLISPFLLVGVLYLVISQKICTNMIEVSSKQSRSHFYVCMHTECCCRCCCCSVSCYIAVAAAAVLLFPAAVRHRVPDGQIWCWFVESDPSVLFFFIQTRFFLCTPWQYCIAFTVSICLRTSPVIAGMLHGEAPLVILYDFLPDSFVNFLFLQRL